MMTEINDTDTLLDFSITEISIKGQLKPAYSAILTEEALAFVFALHEKFEVRRRNLLRARKLRQLKIDLGFLPDYLKKTKKIRESDWKVAPIPTDLQDRRVEITGPAERKMIINALNSGAKIFMADLEDSMSPTFENTIEGQINLLDAIRKTIDYTDPKSGKYYALQEDTATLLVRPRGWHLEEKHILYKGKPMSGSLLDFGLYFFHNALELMGRGTGPYFYLPKIENHREARLWNDVFVFAQEYLGIPQGTIKATVLIETILAAFELDEILWELREHSAGLNCGRWDYIFSFIKKFHKSPAFLLPDRGTVTMTTPFMRAYSLRVIQVCHRRGCHAIGGMAAQIPIKNDPIANQVAIDKVKADKLREVTDGHDGTWVAHPGLVPYAMEIFNEHMKTPNQIDRLRNDYDIKAAQLIEVSQGAITEAGIRLNINVGILYVENWLRGNGCAALYNLMEDAATAEISRSQLFQWLKHQAKYDDGKTFTTDIYHQIKAEELAKIEALIGPENYKKGRFAEASALYDQLVLANSFSEFLTLPAYKLI